MELEHETDFNLHSTEVIKWTGRPDDGYNIHIFEFCQMLFGAGILEYIILAYPNHLFKFIILIIFSVFIYFIAFHSLFKSFERKRNCKYCITNERIIIINLQGYFAYNIKDISPIEFIKRPNKLGSIDFGESAKYNKMFYGIDRKGLDKNAILEDLEDAQKIIKLIHELKSFKI